MPLRFCQAYSEFREGLGTRTNMCVSPVGSCGRQKFKSLDLGVAPLNWGVRRFPEAELTSRKAVEPESPQRACPVSSTFQARLVEVKLYRLAEHLSAQLLGNQAWRIRATVRGRPDIGPI
jgi:hypothetical protein